MLSLPSNSFRHNFPISANFGDAELSARLTESETHAVISQLAMFDYRRVYIYNNPIIIERLS